MSGSVEIPLRESDEVIEIPFSELPEGEEVLGILSGEKAPLHLWVSLGVEYYRQGKVRDFVTILETCLRTADINYEGYDRDQMRAYDTLAAYYVQVKKVRIKNRLKKLEKPFKNVLTTTNKLQNICPYSPCLA